METPCLQLLLYAFLNLSLPRTQECSESAHDLLVQFFLRILAHRRPVEIHLGPQQGVPRPRRLRPRPEDGLKALHRPLRLPDDEVVGRVELLVDLPVAVVGERLLRVEPPLPDFLLFLCQFLLLVGVVIFQLGSFFWSKMLRDPGHGMHRRQLLKLL